MFTANSGSHSLRVDDDDEEEEEDDDDDVFVFESVAFSPPSPSPLSLACSPAHRLPSGTAERISKKGTIK